MHHKPVSSLLSFFAFLLISYQCAIAQTTAQEKKTDSLARKILTLINQKQPDSVYAYAGSSFKNQISAANFKHVSETSIYPLLPFPDPVFLRSKGGVNIYRVNQFQILIGLDSEGKYHTLLLQPYQETAVKADKALSDNPLKTSVDSAVHKVLSAYIQTKGNVGLSAGIYYQGKTYVYNYGETSLGKGQLPTSNTLYDIGSITKTFTSTLLALAVSQGKASLSTPIIKFLPDSVALNSALKDITLEQLANHTSGLPRLPDNGRATITDPDQPYGNYDINHLFSYLKSFKASRTAGSMFEYSNLGIGLLGVLLERIFKEPYQQLIHKYITKPANLSSTYFSIPANSTVLAQGYNEAIAPVPVWNFRAIEAAGALKSSVTDLLSYGKLQLTTNLPGLKQAIPLTHRVTYNNSGNILGLGWLYLPNQKVIYHGGGTAGYRSLLAVDLEKNIVVALLTNNASTGDATGFQLMKALQNTGKLP